ncbi:primosomal protein N' [Candidatus Falkowbacteria bacterium]|nr:primosomal protein N' [Candidatus Falkowbacteria bacterium]
MVAEIIPLARLPKNLSVFDYEVPENFLGQIKIGQIVKISFRNKNVKGIVMALKSKPDQIKSALKPFIKIIDPEINIDNERQKFLHWFADYYLVSPALVLKTFLPEPPEKLSSFKSRQKIQPASLGVAKNDLDKIQNVIEKVSLSKKPYTLFHHQNNKNKIVALLKITQKIISEGKSVLILLPQVPDIANIAPYFLNLFYDQTAMLHGELSKTEYWQEWQKIKNGKAKIVIGTRSALFAPLSNLGLIIIDNEEAPDFKQSDQNPRYDTRDASLKLAELTGAKIIFTSLAPRPETFFLAQNRPDFNYLPPENPSSPIAALADMNDEIKNKNFSSLGEKIKKEISAAVAKQKKVILLLNRRGLSTMILCRDCDHVFKCKTCDLPLACHDEECGLPKQFICHNCGKTEPVQLVCPKCRGTNIKYLGVGTQTVEKEIKKIFPQINVLRIDKDVPMEKIYPQISGADIFIGTQFLVRNYLDKIKDIGFLGVISADTMIYRPDFRSGEKIYSWLMGIINFAREAKISVLVQTFFPNNFVIRSATQEKPELFYLEELDNREALGYPPFGKLIKLAYGDSEEKKCTAEATKLFKILKTELKDKVDISYDEKPRREKRKFFSKIIIKFSDNSAASIKEMLRKNVPDSWTIDIDPENVL